MRICFTRNKVWRWPDRKTMSNRPVSDSGEKLLGFLGGNIWWIRSRHGGIIARRERNEIRETRGGGQNDGKKWAVPASAPTATECNLRTRAFPDRIVEYQLYWCEENGIVGHLSATTRTTCLRSMSFTQHDIGALLLCSKTFTPVTPLLVQSSQPTCTSDG
jgi:hypothetical protein